MGERTWLIALSVAATRVPRRLSVSGALRGVGTLLDREDDSMSWRVAPTAIEHLPNAGLGGVVLS
ncbi:hypothetical protein [Rathayibacter toxicus]|uniref:Uncharacterized protein n=1 Tax=Rathayibacter toxicus TaxID=145458 RepID=A0A0C5BGH3_9MICO|nr:hypothetical protein [Rathayibacter toxicus]AJM77320.1 hypothetical protein TI83_03810 [Rathayibacter toxicus]ALS56807.1 hypothetical protein APU90_02660 [Rathayibacter toxicus]KKM46347.1 hypothetical protein VT73_04835 [Rathayibacter toxicus]PPG23331.1 hypothetical protein C5D15_03610 [Rathayibacter toxicus]PPG47915.1 hypothetical protein C5D16_03610 [Rathayibacter toxicus]